MLAQTTTLQHYHHQNQSQNQNQTQTHPGPPLEVLPHPFLYSWHHSSIALRFALLSSKVYTLALFYFIFPARFWAKVLKFALWVPAGLKLKAGRGATHTQTLREIEKLLPAFETTRKIAHTPRWLCASSQLASLKCLLFYLMNLFELSPKEWGGRRWVERLGLVHVWIRRKVSQVL